MRIKVASNRVYDGAPDEILRRLHRTSDRFQNLPFREYMDGMIERLRPVKVWLEVPEHMKSASDDEFAKWLGSEMLRVGRWSETNAPTEEEKEVKAKAAAEAKKKAAAEKAAAAKAAAEATPKPDGPAEGGSEPTKAS